MKLPGLTLFTFLIVFASKLHGQVDPNLCYPKVLAEHDSSTYIFHKPGNGYPDTIHVTGQIVGVKNPICGFLCMGGSIKVKLSKKIDRYPFDYVYIATQCSNLSNKCQAYITITATKLVTTYAPCTLKSVRNVYDKNEIPFYVITSKDLEKLEK